MQRRALLTEHRDILTLPVRSVADEPHLRRNALELVSEDSVKAIELASLDDERQPTEPRPQRLPIHYWPRRHHRCDYFIEHLAQVVRPRRSRSHAPGPRSRERASGP